MKWLFATVIVLLAVLWPKFRKFGLALAGVLIVAIVIIIVGNSRAPTPAPAPTNARIPAVGSTRMQDSADYRIERMDKADPDAKNRIALTEVRLEQIQPNLTLPGSVPSIYARLYNDSRRFTLTDYSYYLTVQDCVAAKGPDPAANQCTTVYDQRNRGKPLAVPPAQARDVTIYVPTDSTTQAPPFKILGKARIELAVTDTRAYRTAETPQPGGETPARLE